jgi:hypothetical protein
MSSEQSLLQIMIDQKQLKNVECYNYLDSMIINYLRCTRDINPGLSWQKQHFTLFLLVNTWFEFMRRFRLVAKRSNFLRRVCPHVSPRLALDGSSSSSSWNPSVKKIQILLKSCKNIGVILQEDVRFVWFVVTGDMKSPYQGKIDHVRVTLGERHGEFSVRLFLCKSQTQVPILCVS